MHWWGGFGRSSSEGSTWREESEVIVVSSDSKGDNEGLDRDDVTRAEEGMTGQAQAGTVGIETRPEGEGETSGDGVSNEVWEELLGQYCENVERQEILDQWSRGSNFELTNLVRWGRTRRVEA